MSCSFVNLLSDLCTIRAGYCKGTLVPLSSCNGSIDEQPEIDVLLLRAALQRNNVSMETTICEGHRACFGDGFVVRKDKCVEENHSIGIRKAPRANLRKVDFDISYKLLKFCGRSLPFGTVICTNCRKAVGKEIEIAEAHQGTEILQDSEPMDSQQSYASEASSGTLFQPSQERSPLFIAFNNLLEVSNERDVTLESTLCKPYEKASKRWQKKFIRVLAAGVRALTNGITENESSQLALYQDLVKSKKVEAGLVSKPVMDEHLETLIRSYNNASDWLERRRILSLLVPKYDFAQLAHFNPDLKGCSRMEVDEDLTFQNFAQEQNLPVLWRPALTQKTYRMAKLHYHR